MTQSKKGAALALNVIIIAVIGLLVLVVILFIFTGKINIFSKGVSDCESLGGVCQDTQCSKLIPMELAVPGGKCDEDTGRPYCCKSIG